MPTHLIAMLVCLPLLQSPDDLPRDTEQPLAERAAAMLDELAALGFEIDVDTITIEARDTADCREDVVRQQAMFFDDHHFDLFGTLFAASFGDELPDDRGAELMQAEVQRLLATMPAYYQADRRALVFTTNEFNELSDPDYLLAHELAHAWRDERLDLAAFVDGMAATSEGARIAQCLLEGEAELIALAVSASRRESDLASISPETSGNDVIHMLLGDSGALPYTAGRRLALTRYRSGGWASVDALFAAPPSSTEQIIHPEKLGLDLPRQIPAPVWQVDDAPAHVHSDTLGELGLIAWLTQLGGEVQPVRQAALGWDGDALHLYRDDGDLTLLVWRSVWDRREDAQQAQAMLDELARGTTYRRGASLDWVWAGDDLDAETTWLHRLTKQAVAVLPDERDAQSTAAAEQALQAQQDVTPWVAHDSWVHPEYELHIPVPDGFRPVEMRGVTMLMQLGKGFADNLNVTAETWVGPRTTEKLIAGFKQQMQALAAFELDEISTLEIDGRELALARSRAQVMGNDLAFITLMFLADGEAVYVTGTVQASRADSTGAIVEAALRGVHFGPAGARPPPDETAEESPFEYELF